MKKAISIVSACILLVGIACTASAIPLLEIRTNGDSLAGNLPLGSYHDIAETRGTAGWYNANLYAYQNVILTYEYLGYEAGWTNTMYVDGSQSFWNRSYGGNSASTPGDAVTSTATAGNLLDFAFAVLAGGNAGNGVENGANNFPVGIPNDPDNGYGAPNFFLGYADAALTSVYIALDDGGGGPWRFESIDDDDHDDMVIKVTARVAPIPEPGTILLFVAGLTGWAGAGYIRRKKHI